MPKKDDVGFGEFTGIKMETLASIFNMHLVITQKVLKNHLNWDQVYTYIDATSGKGVVPDTDIFGSPLTFLKSINSLSVPLPFFAHFVEQNPANLIELQQNIEKFAAINDWNIRDCYKMHAGDYAAILPPILKIQNSRKLGLLFVDHSGNLPNFDAIANIINMRPKMEILLYLSARNIKRIHHLTNKSLLDYMQQIGKSNWLIRKPVKWDNLEWTFLLGSNTDIFKDYKKIDFYRLDSDEAQFFFPKINLTSKERMEKIQPRLPSL